MKRYMSKFKWILLFLLISNPTISAPTQTSEQSEKVNYCTDKESWKEWDDLIIKYPGDEDITILHAMRLGLCAKVSRGDITVKQATDIFEKVRLVIIERKEATTKKDKGI